METPAQEEVIFSKGKLFELVHLEQQDGRVFEVARRAPGVRLIIADTEAQTIVLTREFRRELNDWDYRLPGGKVFDSLEEFEAFRNSDGDIEKIAKDKAVAEAKEEAGVTVGNVEFYKKSTLGATVEWDLFVFVATEKPDLTGEQELEDGEEIDSVESYAYEEVEAMILEGKMKEERIALILLQWIHEQRRGHEV